MLSEGCFHHMPLRSLSSARISPGKHQQHLHYPLPCHHLHHLHHLQHSHRGIRRCKELVLAVVCFVAQGGLPAALFLPLGRCGTPNPSLLTCVLNFITQFQMNFSSNRHLQLIACIFSDTFYMMKSFQWAIDQQASLKLLFLKH